MQALSLRFGAAPRAGTLVAALATIIAAYASVHFGATVGAGGVVVLAIYLGTVLTYLAAPHIALAGTIALFSVVPALKVFAGSQVGGVKDVVCLAAFSAAALLCFIEKRWPDRYVGYLVLILLGLYVVDVGGGHGAAWLQGVRLTGEPLLLLLVGWTLPDPRRNLRYALGALLLTGLRRRLLRTTAAGAGGRDARLAGLLVQRPGAECEWTAAQLRDIRRPVRIRVLSHVRDRGPRLLAPARCPHLADRSSPPARSRRFLRADRRACSSSRSRL